MENFDMLVKLYELPPDRVANPKLAADEIRIFRPLASDKKNIANFIQTIFSDIWVNEFEKAMCNTPVSCFIAVRNRQEIVGFSCYDASYLNFIGPIGVLEKYRGRNIGRELLLCDLYAMREKGYGYAIIGWTSEKNAPFYIKSAKAVKIENSFPGIYRDTLG